ncbi:hypothetical protein [Thalassotalea sediminis]|uniref:hypothetical protein n=1 Tax=Thalassotalea sediminis TaxID=1759089 RepID=UPI00257409A4|nr:hypothetical protein [Thalassotalea sediminis]
MSETLPISLHVASDAQHSLVKICSVANRLEAQLNFITMTAGWFADPENEILIEFYINSSPYFPEKQFPASDEFIVLADDVHLAYYKSEHCYQCYIELTVAEVNAAKQKNAVLTAILDKKLSIVLNKIANKHEMPSI